MMLRVLVAAAMLLVVARALGQESKAPAAPPQGEIDPPVKKFFLVEPLSAEAKTRVATVVVKVDPPIADVFVDGRVVEKDYLSAPICLPPGAHLFEATGAGLREASQYLDLAAGMEIEVVLHPMPLHGTRIVLTPPAADKPSRPAIHTGAVVTGGLLLVGVETAERAKLVAREGGSVMQGLAYTSLFSFAGAGAAGGLTLAYMITWKTPCAGAKKARETSFALAPTVGAVLVRGTF